MRPEISGPACRTGIGFPVVTGEVGLSLLDFGARRLAGFADDQLLVSIPFSRMIGIVHALDQGVGGERDQKRESAGSGSRSQQPVSKSEGRGTMGCHQSARAIADQ